MGKEVGAFITDQGVIILPDRFAVTTADGRQGYNFGLLEYSKDSQGYYIMADGKKAHINAVIHTHPSHFENSSYIPVAEPSDEDFNLASLFGDSVAQFIISPAYMNYFKVGVVNGRMQPTYEQTVYYERAPCGGSGSN